MSNEEANFRKLVIKNFRNLAPFCSGTADDRNKNTMEWAILRKEWPAAPRPSG